MVIFYPLGQEQPKQYLVMLNWPLPQEKFIDVWWFKKKTGRDSPDISHTNLIRFMSRTNFKLHFLQQKRALLTLDIQLVISFHIW